MAVETQDFTTGPCTLPDVGTLSYEGCVFSPLFQTTVSGTCVKDAANRTTKLMEYTITVDGYVTLQTGDSDIDARTNLMRQRLTRQGGALVYSGRGCDIIVNAVATGINNRDVAWGPTPELFEFMPLGAGNSAKVKWQVKVRISELTTKKSGTVSPPGSKYGAADIPMLQFCYDTSVSYAEDGYSTLTVRGVLEVPLTRTPNQLTRTLAYTADDLRKEIDTRLMNTTDLSRFRVVRRDFNLSKDKRLLEWSFQIEEKSYMDLPLDCTIARGTYSVRPKTAGMGLVKWLCTLRGTYIVRHDRPRRMAWLAFLALLRERMLASELSPIVGVDGLQNPGIGTIIATSFVVPGGLLNPAGIYKAILAQQASRLTKARNALLCDFGFEEGLYLDSKSTTFHATWQLTSPFSHILLASGLWTKLPETDRQGGNLWATSMKDVSGTESWAPNRIDRALDVIVDFGT